MKFLIKADDDTVILPHGLKRFMNETKNQTFLAGAILKRNPNRNPRQTKLYVALFSKFNT